MDVHFINIYIYIYIYINAEKKKRGKKTDTKIQNKRGKNGEIKKTNK